MHSAGTARTAHSAAPLKDLTSASRHRIQCDYKPKRCSNWKPAGSCSSVSAGVCTKQFAGLRVGYGPRLPALSLFDFDQGTNLLPCPAPVSPSKRVQHPARTLAGSVPQSHWNVGALHLELAYELGVGVHRIRLQPHVHRTPRFQVKWLAQTSQSKPSASPGL